MATRIITAYNPANSYQSIIILISQETLFFCLSNDVFSVEIKKVEEEEIEKKDSEKLTIFYTLIIISGSNSCCHFFYTHCIIKLCLLRDFGNIFLLITLFFKKKNTSVFLFHFDKKNYHEINIFTKTAPIFFCFHRF